MNASNWNTSYDTKQIALDNKPYNSKDHNIIITEPQRPDSSSRAPLARAPLRPTPLGACAPWGQCIADLCPDTADLGRDSQGTVE